MAKRKLLKDMSVDELVAHYEFIAWNRVHRARLDWWKGVEAELSTPARKKLETLVEKAEALRQPQQRWQASRAKKMMERDGVRVAACFLRAYGWEVEQARAILLG